MCTTIPKPCCRPCERVLKISRSSVPCKTSERSFPISLDVYGSMRLKTTAVKRGIGRIIRNEELRPDRADAALPASHDTGGNCARILLDDTPIGNRPLALGMAVHMSASRMLLIHSNEKPPSSLMWNSRLALIWPP